ncbi:PP2C family protein-serine/threonine phosphatase [Mangrovitalea sediminis]|uniref:PP2C family protein-serine/threonine phosphatase n=1 Tax=Mangrovitalea sediminis TaxID=1982043 RepID=UPI000BE545B6|nr:protein phosphatase 2C domain-containing protein [Mangrovitalea sediminis]
MNTQTRLSWSSDGQTHPGAVRSINQDSLLVRPDLGLWAVADGMGGHEAGEVASAMVVETLEQAVHAGSLDNCMRELERAILALNGRLRRLSHEHFNGGIIGSTLVCLLARERRYGLLWAGDSRCYRFRQQHLDQISRDHSEVEELLTQGRIRPDQVRGHPLSNRITRAVGAMDDLELETYCGTLRPGDLFLLCSDGLNDTLRDDDIAYFLGQSSLVDANRAMLHESLIREARDNVTSVLVSVHG